MNAPTDRFVENVIQTIQQQANYFAIDEALLHAAFLFEKARGLAPCGWDEEVVQATITETDVQRLKQAVVEFARGHGHGCIILAKCGDQTGLKQLYVDILKRHLRDDPIELFQAMIALADLGEPIFPSNSGSSCEVSLNRASAEKYLQSHHP